MPLNYGLPKALRLEEFDALLVYGYARLYHVWAMVQARQLGLKVLLRDDVTDLARNRGGIKDVIKPCFFSFLSHLVDYFIAVGTRNREYYLGQGIDPKKIIIAPHAVDNQFF